MPPSEKSGPGTVPQINGAQSSLAPMAGGVDTDFPPFPRTYTRSSFGIKLSESELQERVEGLDRWVRAVCQRYHLMTGVVQVSLCLLTIILTRLFFLLSDAHY
jgi:hypothetical protein